jgi:hypothetical protein
VKVPSFERPEGVEDCDEVAFDDVPCCLVESTGEAIRSWRMIVGDLPDDSPKPPPL